MSCRPALFALFTLLGCDAAQAAVFCVGTDLEIQNALNTAASNGQDDVIRVRAGVYDGQGSNTAFIFQSAEAFDMELRGGYSTVGMQPCGVQNLDPSVTVFHGLGVRRALRIVAQSGSSGLISIQRLTLRDGQHGERGGGMEFVGLPGAGYDLEIDAVLFDRNSADLFGAALTVNSTGLVSIRNSLFLGNECGVSQCAVELFVKHTDTTTPRLQFGNNTVVGNGCSAAVTNCTQGGVRTSGTARGLFYNNVFAYNEGFDLSLANSTVNDVFGNNIEKLEGTPTSSGSNLALDNPGFVLPLDDDYRLQLDSPLRDAGIGAYVLALRDFAGKVRVNGARVDIGAYENDDALFRDGFETP